MKPINYLKSVIFNQKLKSDLKKINRTPKARNPEDCKSFLILLDADDKQAVDAVQKLVNHLKSEGKKVLPLAYTQYTQTNGHSFLTLSKKDVNWIGVPVANENTAVFSGKEWDCVLSLHKIPVPALDYIAATCKASTKAGFYHNNQSILDIMVDPAHNDFQKSLDVLLNILKTIKSRSYEPVV